jgi:IclR family pca regulon transcriptional regulator
MSTHAQTTATPFSKDPEYMATLAKGLSVLGAFGPERPRMTLSEAAAASGLSRAAARRALLTLADLGYLVQDERTFALAPRILELGFAYLATQSWLARLEPWMKELSHEMQESCSAAILQGSEIVYVARMPAPHRLMSVVLTVGTRLPAFYTSLGRIQLGFLPAAEIERRLAASTAQPLTHRAIRGKTALVARIRQDHAQGFSIVDEELEVGLRSIAVPLVTRNGANIGAINLSAHASRATRGDLEKRYLPKLLAVASAVNRTLI